MELTFNQPHGMFNKIATRGENCGVWGVEPPRLEIVGKSDTLSADVDQFLAKRS